MADVTLKGNKIGIYGELPKTESDIIPFTLTKADLSDSTAADHKGKNIIFNIFPSLDTAVCASSVRKFNQEAGNVNDTVVLSVSADLPFAHSRFCEIEGLKNVISLSVFRSPEFGKDYGLLITEGPLKGLLARAVIIADKNGKIRYTELVPEIAQEPDYKKAISFIKENL